MASEHSKKNWYLDRKFTWNEEFLKDFYRLTFGWLKSYHRVWLSNEDFEDIFQESMMKFIVSVAKEKYAYQTNRNAYNMFCRIFRCTEIDFFRKRGSSGWFVEINDDISYAPVELPYYDQIKELDIIMIFDAVDKGLASDPRLFGGMLREFYSAFKIAVLTYTDDKQIRLYIMNRLQISSSYYGKLKSQMITFFKFFLNRLL